MLLSPEERKLKMDQNQIPVTEQELQDYPGSGLECARRRYHRIRKFDGNTATCADCGNSGSKLWGQLEMGKEGSMLLKVGRAVEKMAQEQGVV